MSKFAPQSADEISIATIRALAADVVGKANSGHPGACPPSSPLRSGKWSDVRSLLRCSHGHGTRRARPLYQVRCPIFLVPWDVQYNSGSRFFNANPKSSKWFNRDRFVLSNGYVVNLTRACMFF